jgi:protoporphyrinogen oxidase
MNYPTGQDKIYNMKIAIIGAGLTGLTAGYRLSRDGWKVTIFEKGDDVGGLAGGFKIGEISLEKAYHHIFRTDTEIIKLADELGLKDKLVWEESSIGLYHDKKIYPFMGAIDLLNFKPLDLVSKFRLGLVKIWLEKDNNWEKYKSIPAYEWMQKWCGVKAYQVIWEPLLIGKFGDRYKDISMAWLWARIHIRANSKDNDGKERLGYFVGGFRIVADELVKRIKANGGEIKLRTEVNFGKIEKDFDAVLYTGAVKNIDYLAAINVVFTSKQSLSQYYWHNINDVKSPFLAFIQHTNLIDKKIYGGMNVYYLGTYLPNDDKLMEAEDEKIKRLYFDYLKKIKPEFDEKLVEDSWVYKFKNAQHIVTTDYQIPPSKLSEKVYQSNFAQIFPEDRGTNFAVREGEKVAKLIQASNR